MGKAMTDDKPPFVFTRIFSDPTPDGLINQRIVQHFTFVARDLTDLTEKELEQFFRILIYLAKKLASVWVHLDRYRKVQEELVAKLTTAPSDSNQSVIEMEYSDELFQEFDEFSVQLKSALDHLVKIPIPVLGPRVWSLRTFGSKGNDVRKALENNIPKKHKKQVKHMKKMLLDRNAVWLGDIITVRDKINHFIEGSVPFEYFGVHRLPDESIKVPMWSSDQKLSAALEVVWDNLIKFTEDFIAMFLFLRHKPGLVLYHGPEVKGSARLRWVIATEEEMDAALAQGGWTSG